MRRLLLLSALALMRLTAADPPPARTHTILIKGFVFVPARLEVAVNDTVIWRNEDIVPHTATAKKGFDSKGLDQGQSFRYVAKQRGSYSYICTYHPTMKAELLVK